jgi:Mor family transcriptional regulator
MIEVCAKRNEFKAKIMETLIGKGLAWALAEMLSNAASDAIWKEFGGHRVYFPKGRLVKASPEQIWDAFTGRNHTDLARKFNCTVRRIEQIVAMKTASLHVEKPG